MNIEGNGIEYCILLDKTKDVTSNEFKVNIPRLMPNISIDLPKETTEQLPKDRFINNKAKHKTSINLTNYIIAKSATSLRASHLGDVTMSKSEGITLTETVKKAPIKLTHSRKGGGPHPPHEHMIKDPFKFWDMNYFKLNNVKISNGKKMLGCFVSGDITDFWVTYIPDIIPRR